MKFIFTYFLVRFSLSKLKKTHLTSINTSKSSNKAPNITAIIIPACSESDIPVTAPDRKMVLDSIYC